MNQAQLNDLPTTPEEDEAMDALARLGGNVVNIKAVMGEPLPKPSLEQILKTIGEQFTLLATVINQTQGNSPNTTPPENTNLQDCVSITLEQADWFKDLVAEVIEERVDEHDFDDDIRGAVEANIEDYFQYRFDASDHFDMNDLVDNAVRERIEDVVGEQIDGAVEAYMADAEFKLTKE